jgi:hypothetical protein
VTDAHQLGFLSVAIPTVVVHTVTYTLVGIAAMSAFRYTGAFRNDPVRRATLRDTSEARVMASPLFQPLRGILFAIVFYLLRDTLFAPGGWLVLFSMLLAVGVFGTFAPAAASIEGWIYLRPSPTGALWGGLIEIVTQALLLSVLTFQWVTHPGIAWLAWVFGGLFVLALALPALGLLARRTPREAP